jgi:hypothetical protein
MSSIITRTPTDDGDGDLHHYNLFEVKTQVFPAVIAIRYSAVACMIVTTATCCQIQS